MFKQKLRSLLMKNDVIGLYFSIALVQIYEIHFK